MTNPHTSQNSRDGKHTLETPEQIKNRETAKFFFGNCDDGSLHPDDATWDIVRLPTSEFFSTMEGGADGWREWFAEECSNWRLDYGTTSHWDKYLEVGDLAGHLNRTADADCVAAIHDEGGMQIWDGWHRIAAHVIRGEPYVELVLGRRTPSLDLATANQRPYPTF